MSLTITVWVVCLMWILVKKHHQTWMSLISTRIFSPQVKIKVESVDAQKNVAFSPGSFCTHHLQASHVWLEPPRHLQWCPRPSKKHDDCLSDQKKVCAKNKARPPLLMVVMVLVTKRTRSLRILLPNRLSTVGMDSNDVLDRMMSFLLHQLEPLSSS